jgi:hypothetical protein
MNELFEPANNPMVACGTARVPFEPNAASIVIGPVEFGNPSSHGSGGGGGVKLALAGELDSAVAPTAKEVARRAEDAHFRTVRVNECDAIQVLSKTCMKHKFTNC